MKTKYSKDFIKENLDCYAKSNKRFRPVVDDTLQKIKGDVRLKDVLTSKIPIQDRFWWLLAHTDNTAKELQDFSMKVCDAAVRIYEHEQSGDTRLRGLVEKAKSGINPSVELREIVHDNKGLSAVAINAASAVSRGTMTLFVKAHRRYLAEKAVRKLLIAAHGNKDYSILVRNILKDYHDIK